MIAEVDKTERVCIKAGRCAICNKLMCQGQFALPGDVFGRHGDQAVCAWCFEQAVRESVFCGFRIYSPN